MMLSFLQQVLLFIAIFSVLIAFHEYGHFLAARMFKVKVLRFSLGFGKPILSFRAKSSGTEYAIGAIFLGGYVQMLDGRNQQLDPEESRHAFNHQALYKKLIIIVAGPVFNLVLAAVLFSLVFMFGVRDIVPVVLEPAPHTSAAEAGFKDRDIITAVFDSEVASWSELKNELLINIMNKQQLQFRVQTAGGQSVHRTLQVPADILKKEGDILNNLGLVMWQPAAVIGSVNHNSPASRAGLEVGDTILKINAQTIRYFAEIPKIIKKQQNQPMRIEYDRQGSIYTASLEPSWIESASGEKFYGIGIGQQRYTKNPYSAYLTVVSFSFFQSVARGLKKTKDLSLMTFKLVGKLVVGKANLKNLSGPISIAQYAADYAAVGWVYLLEFMAIISVSLGVLNLLPIPVLDGGNFVIHVLEGIKRSPFAENTLLKVQLIGMLALMMIMSLAFYNDIIRNLG